MRPCLVLGTSCHWGVDAGCLASVVLVREMYRETSPVPGSPGLDYDVVGFHIDLQSVAPVFLNEPALQWITRAIHKADFVKLSQKELLCIVPEQS